MTKYEWKFVETVSPCGQEWHGCGVVEGGCDEFVWFDADPEDDTPKAHLIAAAPDLYEALEFLLSVVDRLTDNRSILDHIDMEDIVYLDTSIHDATKALAKARGEL